ncbi:MULTISPECIES: ScbR family autoregulator-binding transcription factor [Streptomyces]|uniref:ScbR family autoregulator-binding transcription factor n=1 Tax=Streptomyces TaxID=1883 RepID=UPI000F791E41|nr:MULTISPECIES: ScbR family autoregulator-binding transcription factor [Streptomyces]RST05362.1 TetR/AcrR family transcriptional regulator [Streptomyces sp. WAC07149]GLX23120.1 gamma-butyrolactone-binding protein [Streptomyces lavendulae subsp. lavendulae]GLX30582.1 gamma-butyrolactone-binding protein [Streptomyces lavendulae subsp. lavendulae]
MAEQVRAIRTRQAILSAAAKIFEERGYQASTISEILTVAGVTKGALYFHFQSKEDLALGVLNAQNQNLPLPERASKLQEIVDIVMLHTYRLQTDPMVRAGVRLTMDQRAEGLDRSGPFRNWAVPVGERLDKAQLQGELLPHVDPAETADVIVGAYAGIQSMSQALTDYRDLVVRVSALMRHLLPSIAQSSVLASLHLGESRAAEVYHEALLLAQEREAAGALS